MKTEALKINKTELRTFKKTIAGHEVYDFGVGLVDVETGAMCGIIKHHAPDGEIMYYITVPKKEEEEDEC